MSYDIRRNEDGEMLVMPLEIPMYEGTGAELGKQALISLCSCLRHFAVFDAIMNDGLEDPNMGEPNDILNSQFAQGTEQLLSALMSIVALADEYQIDINAELYDVPWSV